MKKLLLLFIFIHPSFASLENTSNDIPNPSSTSSLCALDGDSYQDAYPDELRDNLIVFGYSREINKQLNINTIVPQEINRLIFSYYFDVFKHFKNIIDLSGHTKEVSHIVYDPQSKTLFSAGYDGNIKVWNPKTGECLRTLSGHSRSVYHIVYDPQSQTLFSAGYDYDIKVWGLCRIKKIKDVPLLQ